jgi:hypothetical protein
MKKFLTNLFSYSVTPALLYAHYVTGNSAFIFLYVLLGLFIALVYPLFGVVVFAYLSEAKPDEFKKLIIGINGSYNGWKAAISWIYFSGAFVYLTYAHCFFSAILCLIVTLEAVIFKTVVRNKAAEFTANVG